MFDWDRGNINHLARHCNDPLIVEEQIAHGELRYLGLGETDEGRRLAFVFTVRGDRVRIITAYSMSRQQQERYDEG